MYCAVRMIELSLLEYTAGSSKPTSNFPYPGTCLTTAREYTSHQKTVAYGEFRLAKLVTAFMVICCCDIVIHSDNPLCSVDQSQARSRRFPHEGGSSSEKIFKPSFLVTLIGNPTRFRMFTRN